MIDLTLTLQFCFHLVLIPIFLSLKLILEKVLTV